MNLQRMLEKCRRDQWSPAQLDFSRPPRAMSRDDEIAVVQYFTNMAGIERLASALFQEQHTRAKSPELRAIFASFVEDEQRHARVAELLAQHYDVHRYQAYRTDPSLTKFAPAFVDAIRYLTPEVANAYITTGEIVLDVALLRSLNDFVDDTLSDQAMTLINRDESRHIAVDFHMVDYYSSDDYLEDKRHEPRRTMAEHRRAWLALARMLFFARPFLEAVFFEPMDLVDPSGKRLLEAFKRVQLLACKPRVARRPFVKFMLTLQELFRRPLVRVVFGRVLVRAIGTDPRVINKLYDDDDERRAHEMSFDEMAEETLALGRT